MLLLQLTKKLSEELKLKPLSKEQLIENNRFYSWHAHVFMYKRKKYSLIMNNETRYNFILGSLRKKEFSQFDFLVKTGIKDNLIADGFDIKTVEGYLEKCDLVKYAPTSDRSVISQINEMISATKHIAESKGFSEIETNLDELNRFNNDFVMLSLPDTFPIKAMEKALKRMSGF